MKINFSITFLSAFLTLFLLPSSHAEDTVILHTSGARPAITSTDRIIAHNKQLLIKGVNFSAKNNASPLLFWSADNNIKPSSLGRKLSWDGKFNGSIVTIDHPGAQIAPGSTKTAKLDHSLSSSAILGRVDFSSDQLYIWRKKYDSFDIATAPVLRTRYKDLTVLKAGSTIESGMWVVGNTTGATGIIQSNNSDATFSFIHFKPTNGTINDDPRVVFAGSYPDADKAENLTVFAADDPAFTTPLISLLCNEGYGMLVTFNNKILRFWHEFGSGQRNNMYFAVGEGTTYPEHTGLTSYWVGKWENPLEQLPNQWYREEFIYQTSSIDAQDGISMYLQNGIAGWHDQRFRHRTSKYSGKYQQIFQNQVSNGAQPGSITFFDSLYIDDSWHRVIICTSSTWSECRDPEIQIPIAWSDTSVTISLRLNHLASNENSYLYIANDKGLFNETGFLLVR